MWMTLSLSQPLITVQLQESYNSNNNNVLQYLPSLKKKTVIKGKILSNKLYITHH